MSDAKKSSPPAPPPAPPATTPKWVPLLVGFNSLLLVGVLGFMAYAVMSKPASAPPEGVDAKGDEVAAPDKAATEPKKPEGKGGEDKAPPVVGKGPGPMVRLPDFVVHLRNTDVDRYARVTFEIEVIAEPDKELLTSSMPRVRDAVIAYMSDRTVEDLAGSDGLGRTKDALYQRIRELVPEARLRGLYISDFVVQ